MYGIILFAAENRARAQARRLILLALSCVMLTRRATLPSVRLRRSGAGMLSPSRTRGWEKGGAIDGVGLIELQSVLLSPRARRGSARSRSNISFVTLKPFLKGWNFIHQEEDKQLRRLPGNLAAV